MKRFAMIDGNGRMGSYSPHATVTKQYPITTLLSPLTLTPLLALLGA